MMFKLLLLALALTLQSAHGKKALVIGHRGSSGYLPEHTLEAKVAAMLMGADYIEQDLVLTKDNIPIVIHDIYLDEVTDVVDKFLGRSRKSDNGEARYFAIDFTLAEIKQLQVTERFHRENKSMAFFASRYPVGQSTFQINTLEEEIQLVKGFEKSYNNIHTMASGNAWKEKTFGIYVELKRPDFHRNESKSNFSEIVLEIVNKYYADSADSQVFIQCFDPIELM
jgi:glycerophosphoryl diester phosphodiesterase